MRRTDRRLQSLFAEFGFRDYLMLINMILYLAVGGVLLYRAVSLNASWLAYLIGAVFLSAGGYRVYLICKVVKGER